MKKSELVFVTATWARTERERAAILETISALSAFGYPIIVGDKAESEYPLANVISRLPMVAVLRGWSLHERRMMAYLSAARVARTICWLEGDKVEFAKDHLPGILMKFLKRKNKNVVIVPGQDDRSFHRYPEFQQVIETAINDVASILVGKRGRYGYGPMIFPARLVAYLKKIESGIDIGWAINAYLLLVAKKKNIPVELISLRVMPPPDVQAREVLQVFRLEQLQHFIKALQEGVRMHIKK